MLQEIGFHGGVPIDEDFITKIIGGIHNIDIADVLFPDDIPSGLKFNEDKEAYFRNVLLLGMSVSTLNDPYLKALQVLNVSRARTFISEVYSWEPIIFHDSLDMGWSTLGDICIDEGKLVGCSYYQNSVAVWVADTSVITP